MRAVLGVEGSGSYCHALVVDGAGALLGAGANDDPANWDDVGIEAAGASIRSCVREALDAAQLLVPDVAASVFALAGVDFPMDEQRLSGIPGAVGLHEPFQIVNDSFAALRAGTDGPCGVVVVAGNGSVVAGRDERGEMCRSLGMGPMFGDSGSATDLAESGVTAIAHAYLGQGPETALAELLCGQAGSRSVIELLEGVARGRIDAVPFAPTIIKAAEDGDEVAESLLAHAGRTLGATAAHIVRRLHLEDVEFDLVLAGSMFGAKITMLVDELDACVRAVAPKVRLLRLVVPPVVGAALLAIELAGAAPAPEARAALARDVASALSRAAT
ncbi:MAG: BadF/BadG/BcrA/BcrD ATPase family protein [Actinomycetota bacterium]